MKTGELDFCLAGYVPIGTESAKAMGKKGFPNKL